MVCHMKKNDCYGAWCSNIQRRPTIFVLIYYDLYDGNLLLECFNQIFDAAGDEVVFVEGSWKCLEIAMYFDQFFPQFHAKSTDYN